MSGRWCQEVEIGERGYQRGGVRKLRSEREDVTEMGRCQKVSFCHFPVRQVHADDGHGVGGDSLPSGRKRLFLPWHLRGRAPVIYAEHRVLYYHGAYVWRGMDQYLSRRRLVAPPPAANGVEGHHQRERTLVVEKAKEEGERRRKGHERGRQEPAVGSAPASTRTGRAAGAEDRHAGAVGGILEVEHCAEDHGGGAFALLLLPDIHAKPGLAVPRDLVFVRGGSGARYYHIIITITVT